MNNITKIVGAGITSEAPDADNLSRVVKIAIDSGEVSSVEEGYELFRSYSVAVSVGPEVVSSATHQVALLTIVNIGRRSLLGGVFVGGNLHAPLLTPLPGYQTLAEAVVGLGGFIVEELPKTIPTLVLGSSKAFNNDASISLTVLFSDWRGGVIPTEEAEGEAIADAISPAAILAAAFAVSEVFQHLRGNVMAGRRRVGLSLWRPDELDWESAQPGPMSIVLPSRLWLIGLGHLGQAYLWVLGLLPYRMPSEVTLVLQDFDSLAYSNDSTSLLTHKQLLGRPKTRAMAEWAEARGFKIRLMERLFPGGIRIVGDEPRIALGGVDNPQARAAYEDAGFDWIVESGLGAGPIEYLALRLHTFPASSTARKKWGDATGAQAQGVLDAQAYKQLAADGMEQCGLVRLATRTVGAPFVGTIAASLVVAEVLRLLNGGHTSEVVDLNLCDPLTREVIASANQMAGFNPGFTR